MQAIALHLKFEFLAGLRNRTLLLMNYLMPLGCYALIGGMMIGINPFFKEQVIPAMTVFAVLSGTILGLPTPLIDARESEILRNYRINGIPAFTLLLIPSLSTAAHMILVSVIIAVTAPLFFQTPLPINWPAFLLVVLLLLFAYSAFGALIGVAAANTRISLLWQQLIYLPSMLLGGLMVPVDMLPAAFLKLSHLLPATYAMQAFNSLAYGRETLCRPIPAALTLFVGGAVAYALAGWLFTWNRADAGHRRPPALALLALAPYLVAALLLT